MRLRHLDIKGFRGFANFTVRDLRQVNLVIGRNNAGKTSLLEAIYLLEAVEGDPFVAICRDEDLPNRHLELFNGRPAASSAGRLQIGSGAPDLDLQIELKQGEFHVNRHVLQGASYRFKTGEAPHLMPATSPLLLGPGNASPLRVAQL